MVPLQMFTFFIERCGVFQLLKIELFLLGENVPIMENDRLVSSPFFENLGVENFPLGGLTITLLFIEFMEVFVALIVRYGIDAETNIFERGVDFESFVGGIELTLEIQVETSGDLEMSVDLI